MNLALKWCLIKSCGSTEENKRERTTGTIHCQGSSAPLLCRNLFENRICSYFPPQILKTSRLYNVKNLLPLKISEVESENIFEDLNQKFNELCDSPFQ